MFYILAWVENVVWILPVFRQFSGKYRNFFVVMSVTGLITNLISMYGPRYLVNYSEIFMSFVLLISLLSSEQLKSFKYPIILLGAGIVYSLIMNHPMNIEILVMIVLHLLILAVFLRTFIFTAFLNNRFDIFVLVLIMYELSLLIRFFYAATNTSLGQYYYFISTLFEILLGIFFIITKDDSPWAGIAFKGVDYQTTAE